MLKFTLIYNLLFSLLISACSGVTTPSPERKVIKKTANAQATEEEGDENAPADVPTMVSGAFLVCMLTEQDNGGQTANVGCVLADRDRQLVDPGRDANYHWGINKSREQESVYDYESRYVRVEAEVPLQYFNPGYEIKLDIDHRLLGRQARFRFPLERLAKKLDGAIPEFDATIIGDILFEGGDDFDWMAGMMEYLLSASIDAIGVGPKELDGDLPPINPYLPQNGEPSDFGIPDEQVVSPFQKPHQEGDKINCEASLFPTVNC